jgi:hypothetical protein
VSLTKITDHAERHLARLSYQFRGKPFIEGILGAFAAEAQEIEDALWQLLVERSIDAAVGLQLDVLGRIVDQPRNGAVDGVYRKMIRTKVLVNRSTGRVRDLILVTRAALAGATFSVQVDQQGVASVVVRVLGYSVVDADAALLIGFLRDATKAGVRVILETLSSGLEAGAFTFAIAAFLAGSHSSGATTLTVGSTSGFPDTGSLDLDVALGVQETVTYTGRTATTFTGVSATTQTHGDGAAVTLSGSPGLGFGDHNNAATGGQLTGAWEEVA